MHALSTYEVAEGDQPGVFTEPNGAVVVRLAGAFIASNNPSVRVPPEYIEWLEVLAIQITNVLAARELSA